MPRLASLAAALVVFGSAPPSLLPRPAAAFEAPHPAPGFRAESWEAHRQAEDRAVDTIIPERPRALLRTLTEEPHVAGTPADYQTAVYVRDKLRDWGWKADISEYECLINYPVADSVHLALVRPTAIDLPITEAALPEDKDSASAAAFPAFHGYGASGDVTAQVVYANYGQPDDFDALDKLGVDVRGKIVLVRYGKIFRGLKVLNAQRRGAAGMLIASDPADDGYMKGDVYPRGPYRPGSALQRGSVQFLSLGPGDPTTPGRPSSKAARRLPWDPKNGFPLAPDSGLEIPGRPARARNESEAAWERETGLKRREYFPAIPSLPISADAAAPILEALAGPVVPSGWQGGLPFAYHVGPGPAEVRVAITMDYQIRPIWNVVARIDGSVEPERWVMLGNHRDAWTYGAVDPGSGTAATLEACRAIGEAVQQGWKPRRTLVYASWDGEEYGLLGSTEWAEEWADALARRAVLMLNVDSAVAGHDLSASGIPSLRDLFLSAAADVQDPRTGRALADSWSEQRRKDWAGRPVSLDRAVWSQQPDAEPAGDPAGSFDPGLEPLGSGSDYTAFVDRIGVPALDVDFGGHYGVYHSIYDNFTWMERVGDPEFLTHATAARLYARLMMRAAGAEVVPLRFTPYARFLREAVDDLRELAAKKERGSGKPIELVGLPSVIAAVRKFDERARAADAALAALATRPDLDPEALKRLNDALTQVERAFLHPAGLPGRAWFRHTLVAPGLTTGYGRLDASRPPPGLRERGPGAYGRASADRGRVRRRRGRGAGPHPQPDPLGCRFLRSGIDWPNPGCRRWILPDSKSRGKHR